MGRAQGEAVSAGAWDAAASDTVSGRGELRTTTRPEIALIRLAHSPTIQRQVRVSRIDNFSIFEGDIILGTPVQKQGAIISGPGGRWPNARWCTRSTPTFTNPERVTEAIAHWEQKTAIRFKQTDQRERTTSSSGNGGGCSSAVGSHRAASSG